jgi:hypothetical protein
MALYLPPTHFVVHFALNVLFQFWIHTEEVKSVGILEHVLMTPSHHRVHHGMSSLKPWMKSRCLIPLNWPWPSGTRLNSFNRCKQVLHRQELWGLSDHLGQNVWNVPARGRKGCLWLDQTREQLQPVGNPGMTEDGLKQFDIRTWFTKSHLFPGPPLLEHRAEGQSHANTAGKGLGVVQRPRVAPGDAKTRGSWRAARRKAKTCQCFPWKKQGARKPTKKKKALNQIKEI